MPALQATLPGPHLGSQLAPGHDESQPIGRRTRGALARMSISSNTCAAAHFPTQLVPDSAAPVPVTPAPTTPMPTCADTPAANRDDPYFREIESLLRVRQAGDTSRPAIGHLHEDTIRHRLPAIRWLVEVCHEFDFVEETLHLSVNILDRFLHLCTSVASRKSMHLCSAAALHIAAKYEEMQKQSVHLIRRLYHAVPGSAACSNWDELLVNMENIMLRKLNFALTTVSAPCFLARFCRAAGPKLAPPPVHARALEYLGLTLAPHDFASDERPPSLQAAAALHLASQHLGGAWTAKQLMRATGHSSAEIKSAGLDDAFRALVSEKARVDNLQYTLLWQKRVLEGSAKTPKTLEPPKQRRKTNVSSGSSSTSSWLSWDGRGGGPWA